MEVGKSETGRVEGGREASGRSESERGAGMEEQGKRKRGGTRNAGIDSRRQPATSLKHTTESTRLRDSETRFTTVTHHSDHRKGERERERNCLTRHIQTNDRTTLYMSSCGFTGNWPFWVQLWWIKRWIRVNWKSLKDCEARWTRVQLLYRILRNEERGDSIATYLILVKRIWFSRSSTISLL